LHAAIVEAHAVDERMVSRQTEEARLLVAGLGQRGQRADLDEAEAERAQCVHVLGVLVHAGGKSHG